MKKRIAVIGVPSSAGAHGAGVEKAPLSLRSAGLIDRLGSAGLDVIDFGDLPTVIYQPDHEHPREQNLKQVCLVLMDVAGLVDRAINEKALPLVLGGDCTITIGVLSGLAKHFENIGLMYFDGDLDLNTPAVSPSGMFDGMGLSHIIGVGSEALTHIGPRYPLVPEEKVVAFAYNPEAGWIDPYEHEALRRSSISRYPVSTVTKSPAEAGRHAINHLSKLTEQVLVHFDVDAIDGCEFPASPLPHKHGLSFRDSIEVLRVFTACPKLAGLVVTEFDPEADLEGTYARQLVGALETSLAQ